jgi:hypothetical protein
MVDSFVLRSVSQWDSYKEPHFVHDGAPRNLVFPVVRDLTAICRSPTANKMAAS